MKCITLTGLVAGLVCSTSAFAWQGTAAAARLPNPPTQAAPAADTVTLDESMLANIRVEAVRAQAGRSYLTATGKVQFNEDKMYRVPAPLPGQVLDLRLRVGDTVTKDQQLFSIKSREVASLVTDLIQSQRDWELAEKTHAMTQDLFEHQAASRIALQQSENDLAKAKAAIARAEESLIVIGLDPKKAGEAGALRALIPVYSPAAGNVIERTATSGQFVTGDGTPLLTIADLSSVWVLVDVFERDIRLIRVGQQVQVTATAYPDRRFTAQVERIHDKVDPETRTLKVRLLVDNPGLLLKPEMFVNAAVEIGGTAGISVPSKAVFTEAGKSYVMAAVGERSFQRRSVTASPGAAGRVRITSGLRPGDRIVTEGTLLIDLRQKLQTAGSAAE